MKEAEEGPATQKEAGEPKKRADQGDILCAGNGKARDIPGLEWIDIQFSSQLLGG